MYLILLQQNSVSSQRKGSVIKVDQTWAQFQTNWKKTENSQQQRNAFFVWVKVKRYDSILNFLFGLYINSFFDNCYKRVLALSLH